VFLSVFLYICTLVTSLFLHCKVTIDLELHLNKRTKLKPSKGPFARYDIYLYRMPQTKPRVLNGPSTKIVNGPTRAKRRVLRWADDLYPPSPPCSVCSPVSTRSLPASVVSELQQAKPWTLSSYNLWWTDPSSQCPGWSWKRFSECVVCIRLEFMRGSHSGKQKFTNFIVQLCK